MRRRIERLSPALQYEDEYPRRDFWRALLAWEHEAHQAIRGLRDFLPSDATPDIEYEVDDDYNEEEEMEDVP
jgi:hypothetical protein